MVEQAAKQDDKIISDGTSMVWVQPPGPPPSAPITAAFSYDGPINNGLSSNVFIMSKPAAIVGSTATNSKPPGSQLAVTSLGVVQSNVNNTGTIIKGSATVSINGKRAARNGDRAKTWDYSTPPSSGVSQEIENANVVASGTVFIGD